MVFCIIAMVIFGILGIFSAKYRTYFKESMRCVGRMLTLRPCDTNFDQEMKNKIVSKLNVKHPKTASFIYKRFTTISWIFVIVFIASLAYTGYGIFNLAYYGTCDPINPGSCVFTPDDPNKVICPYHNLEPKSGILTIGNFMSIPNATASGKPAVYMFGATWCPHCNWEKPIFINVTNKFDYIITTKIVNVTQQSDDIEIFKHYSPDGSIPLIIINGKYFRTGSGESWGEEKESQYLTALICKVTNNSIDECSTPEISELIEQII
ncbi:MAG: thioredoxin family protein [Candidatus Aenigmatarchaeota archaeon]